MYNIFDIFMVMYFGNEIKLSSDRLSYCLFESNWHEQSEANKKYMLMMMNFFVKPQELIIGKVFPLTLQTFMSVSVFPAFIEFGSLYNSTILQIINFAYTLFNVLKSMK